MAKGFSAATLQPLTDTELDRLADFLDSDAAPEESMDLSMLHGFLTALLLYPKSPDADVWLPQVWGDDGERPRYASAAEQNEIEDLILRLYNQLADELAGEEAFEPMLYLDEELNLDISRPWCYGFTLGVGLVGDAWADALDDEDLAPLLSPIFDCADDEAREDMEGDEEDLARFEHEVAQLLPEAIPAIRFWWIDQIPPVAVQPRRSGRRH
ncbi:YecA/YgfB family protein [Chitinilyticum litopenaei]|uniref:YecA/YgfB family protein n=1 Tax=Chitinilyticum litopenaei TaxID=1121276 RepID=UPI0004197F9D|nr:YecA family protein [Chitinilyticum litopenaei]